MASIDIDRALLEKAVREALLELAAASAPEPTSAPGLPELPAAHRPDAPPPPLPSLIAPGPELGKTLEQPAQGRAEPLPPPFKEKLRNASPAKVRDLLDADRIKHATPARLIQGRAGTRYTTDAYIGIRAEHAVAIDAVHSDVPDELIARLGLMSLRSRAENREQFLLYPDLGRRLDDQSRARLEREGTRGADVQIILSDGLAAWAVEESGPTLLPALQRELAAQGFKLGRPLFVKYGRIGVADEIGVILGAKATLVFLGERPGLGTGDSGSIYTAFGPKLGQDNAEKDCISNVRNLGIPAAEAAREAAILLKRTFQAGGGGMHLVRSGL